jgi:hypothetical protein
VRGPHPADLIVPEIVPQTSPVAGASFAYVCEPTWIQRLVCVTCQLVTDGNAGNRTLHLDYVATGGQVFYRESMGATIAASTTGLFCWSVNRGAADLDGNNFAFQPLLPLWLTASQQVQLNIATVKAGDQLSAIVFTWERYLSEDFEALREAWRQ